jgi:hypothetical protein
VLAKDAAKIVTTDGRAKGPIVPRSFLDIAPEIVGPQIKIGDFAFTPDETDEAIQKRLNTPPAAAYGWLIRGA